MPAMPRRRGACCARPGPRPPAASPRPRAEIAARLAEEGLTSLLAPVARATGYDTIFPLARLENRYMPNRGRVIAAVHRVLEYA